MRLKEKNIYFPVWETVGNLVGGVKVRIKSGESRYCTGGGPSSSSSGLGATSPVCNEQNGFPAREFRSTGP